MSNATNQPKLGWKDVVDALADEPREIVEDVRNHVSNVYLDSEPMVNAIMYGLLGSRTSPVSNVLTYGAGGFGKSEIAKAVLDRLQVDYAIFDMHSGYTTDTLLGGMNFAVWREGRLYYNLDLSLFNEEIVILEEALSAPQEVLTMMRSAITSGVFRQNDQVYHVKTKFIIICTNTAPSTFKSSPDMEALLQRFPYQIKVDWSHVPEARVRDNFMAIVKRNLASTTPVTDADLRTIAFALFESGSTPRIAVQMGNALNVQHAIRGSISLAELFSMFGISSTNMQDILKREAAERIANEIRNVDATILKVQEQIIARANSLDIDVLRGAYQLVDITKYQLDQLMLRENTIVPGVADPYQSKISVLAEIANQIRTIAGSIALK